MAKVYVVTPSGDYEIDLNIDKLDVQGNVVKVLKGGGGADKGSTSAAIGLGPGVIVSLDKPEKTADAHK